MGPPPPPRLGRRAFRLVAKARRSSRRVGRGPRLGPPAQAVAVQTSPVSSARPSPQISNPEKKAALGGKEGGRSTPQRRSKRTPPPMPRNPVSACCQQLYGQQRGHGGRAREGAK